MKHVYYDSLVAENVRCHSAIEMDFPTGKFYVIAGKNGQGKSTVYKCISMALYGDDGASEGDRATIEEMVNIREGKNLSIEFKFHIVNEDESTDNYLIELRNKHKTKPNGLILWRNGIDISAKTKTDTYKLISRILYPRDVYHTIVYFNQQVKDFFTALTSSKQMKIFNAILELSEYDEYGKIAKGVIEQLGGEIIGLKNSIAKLVSSVDGKTELIDSLERRLIDEEKERQTSIINLQLENENIRKYIKILMEKQASLHFDEDRLKVLNSEIAVLNSRISQLTDDAETIKDKTNKELTAELDMLKSTSEHEFLKKKNEIESKYKEQLSSLNSQLREIVNSITSIVIKYDTSELRDELAQFNNEKAGEKSFVYKEISALDSKFSTSDIERERDSKLRKIDEVIDSIKNDVESLKQKGNSIIQEIASLESEVSKDEVALSTESPTCSKCGQKLNADDKKKIQDQIVATKTTIASKQEEVSRIRENLDVHKASYDQAKKDHQDAAVDYSNRIEKKKLERDQKKQILENKLTRIDSEIDAKCANIGERIHNQDLLKERETSSLKEQKMIIENSQDAIAKKESDEIESLKKCITNDFNNKKIEHNKRYDSLLIERQENIQQSIARNRFEIKQKEVLVSDINNVKNQVDEIVKDIANNNATIESNDRRINELRSVTSDSVISEIEAAKNAKIKIEQDANIANIEVQKIEREMDILAFWRVGFSDKGIKNMLIDSSIPFINREWNKELNKIVPGMFTVSFDTMGETKSGKIRDKLSVNVLHNIKGTNQFKLLSGGEKRLIDLSIMKVLKKLAAQLFQIQIHVGLYDEILDSLDDDNANSFCQLMKIMSRDEHVSLITHKMFEHIDADRVFRL